MGFTRAQLESFRNAEVPDLVGPDLRLLFVGINPGLWTAATQTPFAHPGNRFYPALAEAGIIPRLPSFAAGLSEADRQAFLDAGIGISNLVKRATEAQARADEATVRADELSGEELRAGAARLALDVARWKPAVVAIVGLTAYRKGFGRSRARAGKQPEHLAESELWVVPNPSGLNAHDTI